MYDQTPSNQLVIKDRPFLSLTIAVIMIILAFVSFLFSNDYFALFIFLFIGLVFLAVSQSTTIVADQIKRSVTISNRSIFGSKEVEVPFGHIADFDVETSRTRSSHRNRGANYRLILIKTNGERMPMRSVFTSGYNTKARQARELCQFLNLPGWQDKATNIFQAAVQSQAKLTQQLDTVDQGTTSGVTWTIEVSSMSGKPVSTRWFSPDFTCPDKFVLIAQKPVGTLNIPGGGLISNLALQVYRHMLGIYGFLPSDTPGFDPAGIITAQDTDFDQNFTVLCNDPGFGQSILNQWTIIPCKNWADRNPLKTISRSEQPGQLVVLFSPRGVHVAVMGTLPRIQTDDLINLGVDVVKAHGGGIRQ